MHKVNLTGYINSSTSYGLVTLNIIKAATDLKWHVATHAPKPQDVCPPEFSDALNNSLNNQVSFDYFAPSLRIAHQFDMATSIGRGKRVGFTYFEVDSLTKLERHHLNSLDCLLLPTEWAKKVCEDNNITVPITVVGSGYNQQVFKYNPNIKPSEKFIFLSVGKWEVRKQQDSIVEAFHKAFSENDNVELWLSCSNMYIKDHVDRRVQTYKELLGDRFKYIPRMNHQLGLAQVVQMSSCFVSPSLAEGWNLPLLEAMACGKQCIATNYSGHTEFCDKNNAILINPTGKTPAEDFMWFKFGNSTNSGCWCTYDLNDLVEAMRIAYKQGHQVNHAGLETAQKYTWENTVKRMGDVYELC